MFIVFCYFLKEYLSDCPQIFFTVSLMEWTIFNVIKVSSERSLYLSCMESTNLDGSYTNMCMEQHKIFKIS